MKKILTPIFLFHIATSLFGQDAYLKGRISDSKTKETIVGASVVVDDSTGTVTDINGNYFYKVNPGKHKVEFKSLEFKSLLMMLDIKANDTISNDIVLVEDSKQLGIVVVSAGKI